MQSGNFGMTGEINPNYVYPTKDELVVTFGAQIVEAGRHIAAGRNTRKFDPSEYPRHREMPICAKWKKERACLKFEQCGYCPFDHPQDGEACTPEEWAAQKAWLQAAQDSDVDTLRSMLDAKTVDINLCLAAHTKDVSMALLGKTALSCMVRKGNTVGMKLLLSKKAAVGKQVSETMSPLFASVMPAEGKNNMSEVVQIMVDAKADIKERTQEGGQSVLHHAIARKVPATCCLQLMFLRHNHLWFSFRRKHFLPPLGLSSVVRSQSQSIPLTSVARCVAQSQSQSRHSLVAQD